jgi:hypothetical protein
METRPAASLVNVVALLAILAGGAWVLLKARLILLTGGGILLNPVGLLLFCRDVLLVVSGIALWVRVPWSRVALLACAAFSLAGYAFPLTMGASSPYAIVNPQGSIGLGSWMARLFLAAPLIAAAVAWWHFQVPRTGANQATNKPRA